MSATSRERFVVFRVKKVDLCTVSFPPLACVLSSHCLGSLTQQEGNQSLAFDDPCGFFFVSAVFGACFCGRDDVDAATSTSTVSPTRTGSSDVAFHGCISLGSTRNSPVSNS